MRVCAGGKSLRARFAAVFADREEGVRSTSTLQKLAALTAQQRLKARPDACKTNQACMLGADKRPPLQLLMLTG